jgi:hypothetical protein
MPRGKSGTAMRSYGSIATGSIATVIGRRKTAKHRERAQFQMVARPIETWRPTMQQSHVIKDGPKKPEENDDSFIPRLMAIVESDSPENERIDNALKLCTAHAASIKAKHGLVTGGRPTRQDVARVKRELSALHDEMVRRETVYPDGSVTQNVLRASIRVMASERMIDTE